MALEIGAAFAGRRDLAKAISEKAQGPLGGDGGIELAHRTGRGVARVHKGLGRLVASGHARAHALVQRLEIVAAHVDLATHLQHRRRIARKPQRDLAQRADVLRHVFARFTIAARGGLHQHAVFIAQADGQAVELGLGDVGHGRAGQHGLRDGAERLGAVARVVGLQADAPLLGRQVVAHLLIELLGAGRRGVGLGADAEHGHGVAHRPEAGQHRAADALGGRIGRAQLGVRGLDGLQLLKQLVVLGVGQLGRVQRVVLVRGAVQGGAQAGGGSVNIHSCSRLLHMGNLLIR